jgi:hypothetical protein
MMSLGLYLHASWSQSLIDRLMPTSDQDFLAAACGAEDEVGYRGIA